MPAKATLILDHVQIEHKIRRIAYQIYENNIHEDEIIIAGIAPSGYKLAKKLTQLLEEISPLNVTLGKLEIDKKAPLNPIKSSLKEKDYTEKSVILVDDVLNSGTTLIYGIKHFLNVPLKKIQTSVLVDRSHKKFPVKVDFKGISLSTSIDETVNVSFGAKSKVELV